jgi:uncharacterized membrane protein YdjX (TVP38/TMEM64 family)
MRPTHRPLDPHAHVRHSLQLAVGGVILTGLVLTVVFWGPFLWQVLSHQEQLKAWVESYGRYAALVFVAAQVAQVVFFFIPGEVIQIAGGYILGTWRGLGLSYVGITLGAVMAFAIARLLEQAAIDWLVDQQTVRKFDRLVYGKFGFWSMLLLFLLPGVPKDLLCYVAGLTPMPVVTFLVISTIARFPGVLFSSIFGDSLAERDWHAVGISTAMALGLIGLVYGLRGPIEQFRTQYLVTKDERDLLGRQEQENQNSSVS